MFVLKFCLELSEKEMKSLVICVCVLGGGYLVQEE